MSDSAKRFRDRARDCLDLARTARNEADRMMLNDIAADLLAEADKIEAEDAAARNRD